MNNEDYFDLNKKSWNEVVQGHIDSAFYDNVNFIKGKSSLKQIELDILGDVKDKSILHLQCHFGQDSVSLARMGANVTAVDFSEKAIAAGNKLAAECNVNCDFICSNIYDLKQSLNKTFDLVFVSYGAIIWLPDIKKWAEIVSHYLKPGGQLVLAEFHPVAYMFDDGFKNIIYSYFNNGPVIESGSGSYADKDIKVEFTDVTWNHGIAEIISALIDQGMTVKDLKEFSYSPYNCFEGLVDRGDGMFVTEKYKDNLPLTFSLLAQK